MPSEARGAADYSAEVAGVGELPPHRAAIPVPPVMLEDVFHPRSSFSWRAVTVAVALHLAFLAAALHWGQGDKLPPMEPAISVELVERISPAPPRPRPMAAQDATDDLSPPQTAAQDAAKDPTPLSHPQMAAHDTPAGLAVPQTAPEGIAEDSATPPPTQMAAQDLPNDTPQSPGESEPAQMPVETVPLSAGLETHVEVDGHLAHDMHDTALPTFTPNASEAPPQAAEAVPPEPQSQAVATDPSQMPTLAAATAMPEEPVSEVHIVPPLPEAAPRSTRTAVTTAATAGALPAAFGGSTQSARSSAQRLAAAIYRQRVKSRIQRNVPPGIFGSGHLVVGLRLSRSGRLLGAFVLRSSGNPAMDRAAIRCVRTAAPYPPPPPSTALTQRMLPISFRFQ